MLFGIVKYVRGGRLSGLARLVVMFCLIFPLAGCIVPDRPLIAVQNQKPIAYDPAIHARVRVFYGDLTSATVKGANTDEELTLSFDQDWAVIFNNVRPPVHSIKMTPSEFSIAAATALPIADIYKEYVLPAGSTVRVAQSLKMQVAIREIRKCEAPARSLLLSAGEDAEFKLIYTNGKCFTLVRRYNAVAQRWEIVPASEEEKAAAQNPPPSHWWSP